MNARTRAAALALRHSVTQSPLLYFDPSPPLAAFGRDDSRRILVRAANRVGKTRHAAWKLGRYMLANPGARCRAVGPTARQVNNVLARYLAHFLGPSLARGSYWTEGRGFNAANLIKLGNGSICQLMSYEQTPDAHAGDEMDVIWLDEPPSPPIFQESLARLLSRDGALWLTLTAVGRPVKWLRQLIQAEGSTWSEHVVRFTRDAVPWYSRSQVDAWLAEMASVPWQYAQRVECAWEGVTEDRRLSAFSDRNVVPLTVGARQGWDERRPVHAALVADHGEDAGHSAWVLFLWQVAHHRLGSPTLAIRAADCWTNAKRMSAEREARAVADMVSANGVTLADLDFAVGDINSAGKSAGGRSLNQVYEGLFARMMGESPERPTLLFRPAHKGADSIDAGLMRCNQLLDAGQLMLSERAELLCEAAAHWAGKQDDMVHLVDALRYGVVAILDETGAEPIRLAVA